MLVAVEATTAETVPSVEAPHGALPAGVVVVGVVEVEVVVAPAALAAPASTPHTASASARRPHLRSERMSQFSTTRPPQRAEPRHVALTRCSPAAAGGTGS